MSTQKNFNRRERELLEINYARQLAELPELQIESFQVGIYSHKEMMKNCKVFIDNDSTCGYNTVNDPRLGTTDRNKKCETCHKIMCGGHLGCIKLPVSIIHPIYIKHVAFVLNCLCPSCSCLLVTQDDLESENIAHLTGINRLKEMSEYCCKSQISCRNKCAMSLRKYKTIDKDDFISYQIKNEKTRVKYINPGEILKIFECFEDDYPEDMPLLGFDKNFFGPSDLILRLLPVLPPCARPACYDKGKERDDILTKVYNTVVRLCNSLRKLLDPNAPPVSNREQAILDKHTQIKFFWRRVIRNSDKKIKQPQPLVGIFGRINCKGGLIRSNMMGKRCNFNARSVANPDPNLPVGWVLAPACVAEILTFPEQVSSFNKERLQRLLEIGRIPRIIPGGGGGLTFKIDETQRHVIKLQEGDIVHRWLETGDPVIVNRHPTLHRQGMMCLRVKLSEMLDHKVIGLHLSVVVAFNADFDGDEMNLHAPQTLEEVAEALFLGSMQNCIIDESTSIPLTGLHFDNLMGVTKLTDHNRMLKRYQYDELMTEIYDARLEMESPLAKLNGSLKSYVEFKQDHEAKMKRYRVPILSGRSIFSALLFDGLFYKRGREIVIKDGVLLKGVLTKSDVGNSPRSIIQSLYQNFEDGVHKSSLFINSASKMLNRFIMFYPVTIGFADCYAPDYEEHNRKIQNELTKMQNIVLAVSKPTKDPIEKDRQEQEIINHLQNTGNKLQKMAYDNLTEENTFTLTNRSGAKGSKFNLVQIMSSLGQQFLYGKRFEHHLAFYHRGEINVEKDGFVSSSFFEGLNPSEEFQHAAASRVGLCDTATKTPKTGAAHRTFTRFMEGLNLHEDGTVRNGESEIIQFQYGEDGFDPKEMCKHNSKSSGCLNFMDLDNIVDELNFSYGYL